MIQRYFAGLSPARPSGARRSGILSRLISRCLIACLVLIAPMAGAQDGKAVYDKACALCHGAGIAGAPRFGHAQDWAPRLARGMASLYKVALEGSPKGMPPKGGRADLADAEVRAAVDHMATAAKSAAAKAEPAGTGKAEAPRLRPRPPGSRRRSPLPPPARRRPRSMPSIGCCVRWGGATRHRPKTASMIPLARVRDSCSRR